MESTDKAQAGEEAVRHRRRRLAALALAGIGATAVAVWAAMQPAETWVHLKDALGAAAAWVRSLGAGWFFAAFGVLPAVGFPVSIFALAAGPLFGPVLGLPAVLALSGLSMATSLTISYGLARHVLRPWVTRMLGFMGYRIPVVPPARRKMLTVLVRITPGPPYVFQSFLLGLAEVPFGTYLGISWLISTANTSLVIVFGDALAHGKGKVAILALLGVAVLVAAVKITQRLLAKRARLANEATAAGEGQGGEGV
ncbi:MAG: hypothetical protein MUE42_09650 [Opitutaceae bacterium]|jgi:uncharacterized membrane protein YdjX (TVP38/TMEM64 family)|nr:hypothetical protein [Opitutaceae bacterium]